MHASAPTAVLVASLFASLGRVAWADEPLRAPVPEVGAVYTTTAYSVLSTGYGVDRPVTAPNGPTYMERDFVVTNPPQWQPGPTNPHGGYLDVPEGALVECVAVTVSDAPFPIAAVTWWGRAPESLAGVLFYEGYPIERTASTRTLLDAASRSEEASAFDRAAWDRAAKTYGREVVEGFVARPGR